MFVTFILININVYKKIYENETRLSTISLLQALKEAIYLYVFEIPIFSKIALTGQVYTETIGLILFVLIVAFYEIYIPTLKLIICLNINC